MLRTNRIAPGGRVFHVLNRGNARAEIFADEADHRAFEALLRKTGELFGMRLLAYCVMPSLFLDSTAQVTEDTASIGVHPRASAVRLLSSFGKITNRRCTPINADEDGT